MRAEKHLDTRSALAKLTQPWSFGSITPVTAVPFTAQKFRNQYVTRPPTNRQQQKQPKQHHGITVTVITVTLVTVTVAENTVRVTVPVKTRRVTEVAKVTKDDIVKNVEIFKKISSVRHSQNCNLFSKIVKIVHHCLKWLDLSKIVNTFKIVEYV